MLKIGYKILGIKYTVVFLILVFYKSFSIIFGIYWKVYFGYFGIPLTLPTPLPTPSRRPQNCVWQSGTPRAESFNNRNWNTSVIVAVVKDKIKLHHRHSQRDLLIRTFTLLSAHTWSTFKHIWQRVIWGQKEIKMAPVVSASVKMMIICKNTGYFGFRIQFGGLFLNVWII